MNALTVEESRNLARFLAVFHTTVRPEDVTDQAWNALDLRGRLDLWAAQHRPYRCEFCLWYAENREQVLKEFGK